MKCPKCGSETIIVFCENSGQLIDDEFCKECDYKQRLDKVLSKFEYDTPTQNTSGYYYHDYLSYTKQNGFILLVSDTYTHYCKIISLKTVESLLEDLEVQDE